MENMENNEDVSQETRNECPIVDSELCYWVGKNGCMPCYIQGLRDDDDKRKALENWKVMLSNLPADIDSLHESEKCVLCKGEGRGTECYASVDMAHPEPKSMKSMFFGIGKKVRSPVGSLVTINLASCNECRKKYKMMDSLMWIILFGMVALAFVLASIPVVIGPLSSLNQLLPIALVAGMALLGYLLGRWATNRYRKKISPDVVVDIAEIPLIKSMFDKGWTIFQDNQGRPKLFFKTKKTFGRLFCKDTPAGNLTANVEKQP